MADATAKIESFARITEFITAARERVGTVVVGQETVVERILVSLFTGGHLLLQGVPGLAKTLLVSVLSKSIDLESARIQFTIDLLPSDILGSEILDQRTNEFRTHQGPIFTNLLLADEINRAAPKVQSALLEAMQERTVTIGNQTFALPAPFTVIATQNPVEQSGTFELPEAQLDRFMLCHRLDYPNVDEEREILRRNMALGIERKEGGGAVAQTEFDVLDHEPVGGIEDLVAAMEAIPQVYVSDTFLEHVVELVGRTRRHPAVELGCSPPCGNRPDQGVSCACPDPRPRVRRSGRPVRPGRRRHAASHAAELRGARRRKDRRRRFAGNPLRFDRRRKFARRQPSGRELGPVGPARSRGRGHFTDAHGRDIR